MTYRITKNRFLIVGICAACLFAIAWVLSSDSDSNMALSAPEVVPQPENSRTSHDGMSQAKWNVLISKPGGTSENLPGIFRAWLRYDLERAVVGFADLVEVNPDLALRTCSEFIFMNGEQPVERLLEAARVGLEGDSLRMFEAGVALVLAEKDPCRALKLFMDSGVSMGDGRLPNVNTMEQELFRRVAATDPMAGLKWIDENKDSGLPVEWRAFCEGIGTSVTGLPDQQLMGMLLQSIPRESAGALEDIILVQRGADQKEAAAQVLLDCINGPFREDLSDKRRSVLISLARHTPDLFESGNFDYGDPQDAYVVGCGRNHISLESGLEWAKAIESPEYRKNAIKGVVHGLLDGGTYFASERIQQMPSDDPIRGRVVSAMIEWLELRGMEREALPWRVHLAESGYSTD
jgi:hypothetical protein